MSGRRRLWGLACALTAACGGEPREPACLAADWLAARQAPDGRIVADHYGVLRPGHASSAFAAFGLARSTEAHHHEAAQRAVRAVAAAFERPERVDHPTYAAAFTLLALDALDTRFDPADAIALEERLVAHLRAVQLVESNGWTPDDPVHGAFGLGRAPVPAPDGAALASLSITSHVVLGLRAAGVAPDDPMIVAARGYVERCQDLAGDSGGFCFTTAPEEARSKAGDARPYGTPTADGLRALRACGVPDDHPRVVAARRWLERHFDTERVPGFDQGSPWEPALRTYWAASAAQALAPDRADLVQALAAALAGRQRADGSFVGVSGLMKEDDPVIATGLALIALTARAAVPARPKPR